MNESYSARKERRGRKTEIWVKLKNNTSHKSVHMVSKWLVKKIGFQKLWDLFNSGKQKRVSEIYFAIFTPEHLCWSLFLMKLQAWRATTLWKRDSNTSVFLWAASFIEHLRRLLLIIGQIKDQARRKGKKCWKNIKKKRFHSYINIYFCSWHRRVTREVRGGEVSPAPF